MFKPNQLHYNLFEERARVSMKFRMKVLQEQEFLKVLQHFSKEKDYRLLSGPINSFTDNS